LVKNIPSARAVYKRHAQKVYSLPKVKHTFCAEGNGKKDTLCALQCTALHCKTRKQDTFCACRFRQFRPRNLRPFALCPPPFSLSHTHKRAHSFVTYISIHMQLTTKNVFQLRAAFQAKFGSKAVAPDDTGTLNTLNTLQHTATHCNTLQHTCSTLQCTATHCNALQFATAQCNALQHAATH